MDTGLDQRLYSLLQSIRPKLDWQIVCTSATTCAPLLCRLSGSNHSHTSTSQSHAHLRSTALMHTWIDKLYSPAQWLQPGSQLQVLPLRAPAT